MEVTLGLIPAKEDFQRAQMSRLVNHLFRQCVVKKACHCVIRMAKRGSVTRELRQ